MSSDQIVSNSAHNSRGTADMRPRKFGRKRAHVR